MLQVVFYLLQCLTLTGTLSVWACVPLTSLSDLSAHKLHRPPDAGAVCNIQQEGLQPGGGRCFQICCTFLCQTRSYDLNTFSIQLSGQKVSKATVTAGDENMFLMETLHFVRLSDEPADCGESNQKYNTWQGQVWEDYLQHRKENFFILIFLLYVFNMIPL